VVHKFRMEVQGGSRGRRRRFRLVQLTGAQDGFGWFRAVHGAQDGLGGPGWFTGVQHGSDWFRVVHKFRMV
jgi:hypothetical protein